MRCRRRVRNIDQWKRNIAKRRRNEGKEYITKTGNVKKARAVKPGCGTKCRCKCHQHFNTTERHTLFHRFWQMGDINKQRSFILKFACMKKRTERKGKSQSRNISGSYNFPVHDNTKVVKVCKTFFLHTLSISERYISTAHRLSTTGFVRMTRGDGIPIGQTEYPLRSFPTMESHYCRKDTNKDYLGPELSVSKLYSLYLEKCREQSQSQVSLSIYRKIFNYEYNIAIHHPIQDQCDFCVSFENSNEEQKAKLQNIYKTHTENKTLAREAKEIDKVRAKTDASLVCACFDLQQILPTPSSFESSLYYKRRLNTFNLTVYDMANRNGHCFLWNESISNRGACEIARCVYNFIAQKAIEGKTQFIFYSDNCCSQNKNKFYVTMLWFCLLKFKLTSITHRYLEKGNTQNENDSINTTIEKASKHVKIYTTPQWAAVIRMKRRGHPYNVREMSFKDFIDFKQLSKNIKNFEVNTDGLKVYWNKIK
ncbi:hypothetical protein MAR_005985, partial [Mya arenaria]